MDYFSVFAKADGLDSDEERILRESLTARSWNSSGGYSWENPCREITEPHPNIVSDTAKEYQEP